MKDIKGNDLHAGDNCAIYLDPQKMGLCLCKIMDIHEGGINLDASRGQNARTPARVHIILDMILVADPNMPVLPMLCKIVTPEDGALVDKIAKTPPSGDPIKFPKPD